MPAIEQSGIRDDHSQAQPGFRPLLGLAEIGEIESGYSILFGQTTGLGSPGNYAENYPMNVTPAEFARHIGKTRQYVNKLIRSGRVAASNGREWKEYPK
jgi:hypothetical protein